MNLDTFTLLQLQQESQRREARIGALHCQLADETAELTRLRGEIAKRNRPSPEPRCSDHAVLRVAERGPMKIDVEGIRRRILSPDNIRQIKLGATCITVDGVTLPVRNNVVITGLDGTMRIIDAETPRASSAIARRCARDGSKP